MIVCPGCGVDLPRDPSAPAATGYHASAECWQVYGELVSYSAQYPAELGRWHEICVDAFRAQHVCDEMSARGVVFALNGLYLVYERGFTGLQAREAHGYLANRFREWERIEPPAAVGDVTVLDVVLASHPDEHVTLVEQWGRSVWAAWSHAHATVAELTDRQLTGWQPSS